MDKGRSSIGAIGRSIGFVLAAALAGRALGVVKSFLLARLLPPADYGVLLFLLLLAAYAPIFALGTVETMLLKVPFLTGAGDRKTAQEIENGTFTFISTVAALFALAALAVPAALQTRLVLLSVSFSMLTGFAYHRLEAHRHFDRASAITTARSVSVLVLQLLLGYRLGLLGAILGFLASEALVCAYAFFLCRGLPNRLRPAARASLYAMLIATGLPITVIWWTYTIQTSVDRLFSMAALGQTATGYYGIGMSLASAYLILPEAISQVLYPSVSERFGATRKARELVPLVVAPARWSALLLPLLTSVFLLGLPLVFSAIVPAYLPGLTSAEILIVGALFGAVVRGGANFLVSTGRQRRLLIPVVGSLVLNAALNVLFISLGWGIEGIAAATAISSACLSFAVWQAVFGLLGLDLRGSLASTLELLAPPLLFALLAGVGRLVPGLDSSAGSFRAFLPVAYCAVVLLIPGYRRQLGDLMAALRPALSARLRRGQASRSGGREPR